MQLRELLKELFAEGLVLDIQGSDELEVTELVYDSRKAVPSGSAFVCISGAVNDGHQYAEAAVQAGASVIVAEKELSLPEAVTLVRVQDTRKALAFLSAAWFGHPARELTTIGITGTKGKTTTAYMVHHILESVGIKAGLVGTVEVKNGAETIPANNTTPESYLLQKYFREMADNGCRAVVMEVSSQGLKLSRVAGFTFDYGIFTNLEPDHIGPNEHADFEEYAACKALLFRQCRFGILNADDLHMERMLRDHTCEVMTYGCNEGADLRATEID
ncbi:MAG: Mur ligase family protein, partial [Lachnospiraceae bacterium]